MSHPATGQPRLLRIKVIVLSSLRVALREDSQNVDDYGLMGLTALSHGFLLMCLPCCVFRCGHSGGLHRGVCSGCDKPPPLPAAAGPAEQQHQRRQQTQHVHGLQDRDAPPQLSQGQHEGVLHLTTVCALWT